jgi:hypothetical protein
MANDAAGLQIIDRSKQGVCHVYTVRRATGYQNRYLVSAI